MNFLAKRHRTAAQEAYASLKNTFHINGTMTGFLGIEAIYDAFGVVVDCMEKFQAAQCPALHVVLPILYQVMRKLSGLSIECEVWRRKGNEMGQPSIYSRNISAFVVQLLRNQIKHHPLFLVGCYSNPGFTK